MKSQFTYSFPLGDLRIVEMDGEICSIDSRRAAEEIPVCETALIKEAHRQLAEYFAGTRKAFSLPLAPVGTAFQKRVWKQLLTIPYGETRSYGQLAASLGNPKASRAVGGANHNNPIMIVIPCHRVIGVDGSLTGYAGGVEMKQTLLALEAAYR